MRRLISSGSPFEAKAGYSRAVVQGDWCFVSGTTGYDYARMIMPEDVGEQARAALRTIADALDSAGFSVSDIVRLVVYLADAADFETVAGVLGGVFADIRPANTTVVAQLVKPEMKVEIEATALRRGT